MFFFEITKHIEKVMLGNMGLFASAMPVIFVPKGLHEL
jgi:hypothetical protein